jgi:hypothetical protein
VHAQRALERGEITVGQASQAAARGHVRAADAVVVDLDDDLVPLAMDVDPRARRAGRSARRS